MQGNIRQRRGFIRLITGFLVRAIFKQLYKELYSILVIRRIMDILKELQILSGHTKVNGIRNRWKRRLSIIMYAALLISLYIITTTRMHNRNRSISYIIYEDLFYHLFLWVLASMCYHMSSRQPSDAHTWSSLLGQYFLTLTVQCIGNIEYYKFKRACKDPRTAQAKQLKKFLKANKSTRYGKDYGLDNINSIDEFRNLHPLTTYKHYIEYFKACLDGEENVMFDGPTDFINTTSGTTSGVSKEFPRNRKLLKSCYMLPFFACMIVSLEKDLIPLKKWPQIFIKPGVKFNKRGIQRGSSSTLFKRMPHTQSPSAAFYITNELSSIYVHAVFAIQLSDANLLFLQIAPIALLFFKMIEKNWEIMCNDIESGTISRDVIIDDDVRQQINEEFEPDPGRAAELRSIFRRGMKNIVRRIWPEMAQLVFLASATYSAQTKIVKEEYARDVAISSNIHMATEGVYGIKAIHPIYPDDFEYVFLVNYQFFEFIHIDDIDEENPKTLLLHELKVNEKYELVITTREGLYRYRTQDIIKVTGYQDSTPQYQLLGRSGDVLNLRSEKVHVDMVIKALYYSANWSDLQIANYTCTENIHVENILDSVSGDLYYVIFVEFTTDIKMNDEQILQIDEVLSNHVENYKDNRKNGAIQAVKIEQVKIGTFDKLRNMQLENNPDCCFGQYKTPRILRRRDYLKFLLDLRIA